MKYEGAAFKGSFRTSKGSFKGSLKGYYRAWGLCFLVPGN